MNHVKFFAFFPVSFSLLMISAGCSGLGKAGDQRATADLEPAPCNLVTNGNFELDVSPTDPHDESTIPEWTPEIADQTIPAIEGGPGPRITQGDGTLLYPAPEGKWYAMLRWVSPGKDVTYSGESSISQSIGTVNAGSYKLTFSEAAYPFEDASQQGLGDYPSNFQNYPGYVRVQVALTSSPNAPIFSAYFYVAPQSGWQTQTAMIPIPYSGDYTIKFGGYLSPSSADIFPSNYASFVDNIILSCQPMANKKHSTTRPAN
jgi:hypothetical protein